LLLRYKKYVLNEDAEWITFVHGAGGSSAIWHKQIKTFKPHFNLLLIDLRGHGMSNGLNLPKGYNLDYSIKDILEVIDSLKIKVSSFMGVSLGTILVSKMAQDFPDRVKRVVLCGAITNLTPRTTFLLWSAKVIKGFTPPLLLYKLFAYIIMPRKNHQESRLLFIKEASKIKYTVFKRWLSLLPEVKLALQNFSKLSISQDILFISGEEDYLFIDHISEFVASRNNCSLVKLKNSGHVANIDQAVEFNAHSLDFVQS
jgi:pimeloyl-ACP methyl ester carboxylesterase